MAGQESFFVNYRLDKSGDCRIKTLMFVGESRNVTLSNINPSGKKTTNFQTRKYVAFIACGWPGGKKTSIFANPCFNRRGGKKTIPTIIF